jgi:indole-3-glycerol phosphate synthase
MREAGADGLLVGSAIMDGPVLENTERFTHARE